MKSINASKIFLAYLLFNLCRFQFCRCFTSNELKTNFTFKKMGRLKRIVLKINSMYLLKYSRLETELISLLLG